MKWIKIGWLIFLAGFFLALSMWYGGNGKPLTTQDGAILLERLRGSHGSNETGFAANLEQMVQNDDGKEFYAVNLERLKTGEAATKADREYSKIVMPLLFKRAGHPVFVSERAGLMLGEYGNEVDRVIVVRYRSLRDLIEMATEPTMVGGGDYKFAALEHTEVFITRPSITFMHIRLTLALFLILIAWVGLRFMDWIGRR